MELCGGICRWENPCCVNGYCSHVAQTERWGGGEKSAKPRGSITNISVYSPAYTGTGHLLSDICVSGEGSSSSEQQKIIIVGYVQ